MALLPSTSIRSLEPKQCPVPPLLGFCATGVVGAFWEAAVSDGSLEPGSEMAGIGRRGHCFVQSAGCRGGRKGKRCFVQHGACHKDGQRLAAWLTGLVLVSITLYCSTRNWLFV